MEPIIIVDPYHYMYLCNIDGGYSLPDLTPEHVDHVVSSFESSLCCTVNPIAIVHKRVVCQQCFERLREHYTCNGNEWILSKSGS